MKIAPVAALALSLLVLPRASEPGNLALPRATPESQGISSTAIHEFVKAADAEVNEMNSFMLVRHGYVVAEGWWAPYAAEVPHVLYSLSKSFTSTAVGLAIAEGKLSLADEVLKFFPEDAPENPSNTLKSMRVRDLLCMSTGHQAEPRLAETNDIPWTRLFLAHPVPHKPGTHFLYNTPATYMQSAIVQKVTGQTVLDYLHPRLFQPLGIQNPTWGTSPQGISLGGYGLNLRTEDIAKFGQLYLQKGKWNGKQLIPSAWIEQATTRQTSNGSNPNSDWEQGYGFQFWRSRHGAYRGDGAFGQFCIVMPEQDAVVAITSGTRDMQRVMNLVWDILLPALQKDPLPPNETGHAALRKSLKSLSLALPRSNVASPISQKISAHAYSFPPNAHKLETIQLLAENPSDVVLKINGMKLPIGQNAWSHARFAFGPFKDQPVAAAGAWNSDDTFTVKLCFYETPTSIQLSLKFVDDTVLLDSEFNVAFGPTRLPQLIGKRSSDPTRN